MGGHRFGLLAWVMISSCLFSCSAGLRDPFSPLAVTGETTTAVQNGNEQLVWPLPPEEARIEWVGTVRRPADLGIRKGFLGRLVSWITGSGTPVLKRPHGVAIDSRGRLWVTDTGQHEVYVFDSQKNHFLRIPAAGQAPLATPIAVAYDSLGIAYVSDSANGNIRLFDENGDSRGTWNAGNSFVRPTGLAFDAQNDLLWVVDTGKHQIVALNLRGEIVRTIGRRGEGPGEFNFPTHIGLDDEGRLYVVDTLNFRIQILSSMGEPIASIGTAGDGPGTFARPKGIARDRDGHIYVVDAMFDNVQIFDEKGQLLLAFGDHGADRGQFSLPTTLCIDGSDRIYVVDSNNQRLQVFRYLGARE